MMSATDPFDLQRFVGAQSDAYERAVAELRGGRKRTHWMWFVFPQLKGLGRVIFRRNGATGFSAYRSQAVFGIKEPLPG